MQCFWCGLTVNEMTTWNIVGINGFSYELRLFKVKVVIMSNLILFAKKILISCTLIIINKKETENFDVADLRMA